MIQSKLLFYICWCMNKIRFYFNKSSYWNVWKLFSTISCPYFDDKLQFPQLTMKVKPQEVKGAFFKCVSKALLTSIFNQLYHLFHLSVSYFHKLTKKLSTLNCALYRMCNKALSWAEQLKQSTKQPPPCFCQHIVKFNAKLISLAKSKIKLDGAGYVLIFAFLVVVVSTKNL